MIYRINSYLFRDVSIWLVISLLIVFLVALPITTIWFNAIKVDQEVWSHIYNYFFLSYSLNTIILIICVPALTILFGISAAWFVVFYDFYFKKIFSYLLIFPIAIPPYAVAYFYADLTDKGGILFSFLN